MFLLGLIRVREGILRPRKKFTDFWVLSKYVFAYEDVLLQGRVSGNSEGCISLFSRFCV